MLTNTTILAVRALIFLTQQPNTHVFSPRVIAKRLNASPAYLAKVLRSLGKAGILRAEHGKFGGVHLYHPPGQVSLLAIVEACQGKLVASNCQEGCGPKSACAFHKAAQELHESTILVLEKWSLEKLARNPVSTLKLRTASPCLMADSKHHHLVRTLPVI